MNEHPYKPNEQSLEAKTEKKLYVVDLTKLTGSGDFPCPKCGKVISPDDEKEESYTILEPVVKNDELVEIILQCNYCKSTIKLTGFPGSYKDKDDRK